MLRRRYAPAVLSIAAGRGKVSYSHVSFLEPMLPLSAVWTIKPVWRRIEQVIATGTVPVLAVTFRLRHVAPTFQRAGRALHPNHADRRNDNPLVLAR